MGTHIYAGPECWGGHDAYPLRDIRGHHAPQCVEAAQWDGERWIFHNVRNPSKTHERCTGSNERAAKRLHALMVASTITGHLPRIDGRPVAFDELPTLNGQVDLSKRVKFLCPVTKIWTPVLHGQADRPLEGHLGGLYRPGNIVLIHSVANLVRDRARMDVERYRETVRWAAENTVTPICGSAVRPWAPSVKGSTSRRMSDNVMADIVARIESGPFGQ